VKHPRISRAETTNGQLCERTTYKAGDRSNEFTNNRYVSRSVTISKLLSELAARNVSDLTNQTLVFSHGERNYCPARPQFGSNRTALRIRSSSNNLSISFGIAFCVGQRPANPKPAPRPGPWIDTIRHYGGVLSLSYRLSTKEIVNRRADNIGSSIPVDTGVRRTNSDR
jgi:hypothetical protein